METKVHKDVQDPLESRAQETFRLEHQQQSSQRIQSPNSDEKPANKQPSSEDRPGNAFGFIEKGKDSQISENSQKLEPSSSQAKSSEQIGTANQQPSTQNQIYGQTSPQSQHFQSRNKNKLSQNGENIIQFDARVNGSRNELAPQNNPIKEGFCESFRQQNLKGFYFIPSNKLVWICSLISGLLLLGAGVLLLLVSRSVVEVEIDYTQNCPRNTVCTIPITIDTDMPSPVYMYIGLSNFYQNHRR